MPNVSTVTLLFTDLVGSTALLERVGEREAESLRRTHFRILRAAVAPYGGEEVKNLGDGLMVVFPSATNAIFAAIAIQQAVRRHNADNPARTLHVRIGINVGEPIRAEDDYFGSAVVIAKRLCDKADGDSILVSELVMRLAGERDGHCFGPLQSLTLKGVVQPISACAVDWKPAPAQREPLPPALANLDGSAFVGRTWWLDEIERAWNATANGTRQLLVIAGEAGIGKTRLAAEFARAAHERGATVLFGRCSEENLIAYQPFVEALKQYVLATEHHVLARCLPKRMSELPLLVPELTREDAPLHAVRGDSAGQRYRLFEEISSLLGNISNASPLLFVLDDLHWCDGQSALLLKHILTAVPTSALLILATCRDHEIDIADPLGAVVVHLRKERMFNSMKLEGLDERAVGELISNVAGQAPPANFTRAIRNRTEGNPFFIRELLRNLAESGVVYKELGSWTSKIDVDQLPVPDDVRDVILRRLSRLSAQCNDVLRIAAVVGREFDLGVLEDLGVFSFDVVKTLEDAIAANVIAEVPKATGLYSFAHALIREALYGGLSHTRRSRLHGQIAEVLERRFAADPESVIAELAYHHVMSMRTGDANKAIDYCSRAAKRALKTLAYEDAIVHCDRALSAFGIDRPSTLQRCRILLDLGEAQSLAGRRDEAKASYATAARLARELGAAIELATAALGFGWEPPASVVGVYDPELVELLESAAAALGDAPSALRARVLGRLAVAVYWSSDRSRCRPLCEQAVAIARELADDATLAFVLHCQLFALLGPDNCDARLSGSREIIDLAGHAGERQMELQGHVWRLSALLEHARFREADEEILEIERLENSLRRPPSHCFSRLSRTMRTLLDGNLAEAEARAFATFALSQEVPDQRIAQGLMQAFGVQMFLVRREQDRLLELEGALLGYVEKYPAMPSWQCGLACLYADVGNASGARVGFEKMAASRFRDLRRDIGWFVCMTLLAETCHFLDDASRAADLYELLTPYADRCVMYGAVGVGCSGSVSRYLGLLAAVRRDWETSRRHFEHAIQVNERIGAWYWMGHGLLDNVEVLLAQDGSGHHEAAKSAFARAKAIADRVPTPRLQRRLINVGAALR